MHLGSVELGHIRVDVIDGGAVWMDGGTIFGVVPKPLWSEVSKPDGDNRVRLSFLSLLVRTEEATIVIEGGSAAHQPPKMREHFKADDSRLLETLSSVGVEADDVDFFIPSHLHFDHVGGATTPNGGAPVFPAAQYVIQKAEWQEANNPMGINRNAYIPGDIGPLHSARLLLVDGAANIVPGVSVAKTGGHSVGHQMVKVGERAGEMLLFVGDIIPMSQHMNPRWTCAFDLFPVDTYNVKMDILTRAVNEGVFIAPGHGGHAPICTVNRTSKGQYVAQRLPCIAEPES